MGLPILIVAVVRSAGSVVGQTGRVNVSCSAIAVTILIIVIVITISAVNYVAVGKMCYSILI